MPRFILILIAGVYLIYSLWRIVKGDKLGVIDYVLLFLSVVAVGSMVSYILQTN